MSGSPGGAAAQPVWDTSAACARDDPVRPSLAARTTGRTVSNGVLAASPM
ncbi:MAG: hypothetical protein ABSB01_13570 [Streptosporangiaceae bacterium]